MDISPGKQAPYVNCMSGCRNVNITWCRCALPTHIAAGIVAIPLTGGTRIGAPDSAGLRPLERRHEATLSIATIILHKCLYGTCLAIRVACPGTTSTMPDTRTQTAAVKWRERTWSALVLALYTDGKIVMGGPDRESGISQTHLLCATVAAGATRASSNHRARASGSGERRNERTSQVETRIRGGTEWITDDRVARAATGISTGRAKVGT